MILARQRTDLTIANTGFLNNVLHIHIHLHHEREPQSTPPSVSTVSCLRVQYSRPSSPRAVKPSSWAKTSPSNSISTPSNSRSTQVQMPIHPSALIRRVPFKSCVLTEERGTLVAIVERREWLTSIHIGGGKENCRVGNPCLPRQKGCPHGRSGPVSETFGKNIRSSSPGSPL